MKNSSDTPGNQLCYFLTCSTVPQPTVPLPAPESSHCSRSFQKIILSTPRKKVKLIFCNTRNRWTIPGHGKGDEGNNNDEDVGRTGKQRYSFV